LASKNGKGNYGLKSQIDYILINEKWKNGATDCEAYNSFCAIGSDHRIIAAKVKLSLRQSKSSAAKKLRHDWSKLLDDNIRQTCTVEVNNRFQALQNAEERTYISNKIYNNMKFLSECDCNLD